MYKEQIILKNKDADKTLLINGLITHTYIFPYAIRNDEINSCVGFVGDVNKARSLRKVGTSKNVQEEKIIITILGKINGCKLYNENVYMRNKDKLLQVYPRVSDEISFPI